MRCDVMVGMMPGVGKNETLPLVFCPPPPLCLSTHSRLSREATGSGGADCRCSAAPIPDVSNGRRKGGGGGKAKGGKHKYDSPKHTVHTDCHHKEKKKRKLEDEIREGKKKRKEKGRKAGKTIIEGTRG